MTDWQPIETAPKDTPILIYATETWRIRYFICVAKLGKYGWEAVGASGYECENDFEHPTHWMSLPEPPK